MIWSGISLENTGDNQKPKNKKSTFNYSQLKVLELDLDTGNFPGYQTTKFQTTRLGRGCLPHRWSENNPILPKTKKCQNQKAQKYPNAQTQKPRISYIVWDEAMLLVGSTWVVRCTSVPKYPIPKVYFRNDRIIHWHTNQNDVADVQKIRENAISHNVIQIQRLGIT